MPEKMKGKTLVDGKFKSIYHDLHRESAQLMVGILENRAAIAKKEAQQARDQQVQGQFPCRHLPKGGLFTVRQLADIEGAVGAALESAADLMRGEVRNSFDYNMDGLKDLEKLVKDQIGVHEYTKWTAKQSLPKILTTLMGLLIEELRGKPGRKKTPRELVKGDAPTTSK